MFCDHVMCIYHSLPGRTDPSANYDVVFLSDCTSLPLSKLWHHTFDVPCSGSTIVGIGSPDPPAFVYDEEDYKNVFVSGMLIVLLHIVFNKVQPRRILTLLWHFHKLTHWKSGTIILKGLVCFCAEACFLTRDENEWYREPISSKAAFSKDDLAASVTDWILNDSGSAVNLKFSICGLYRWGFIVCWEKELTMSLFS